MIGSPSHDRVLLALVLVLSLEGRLVAPFPNTAAVTCGYQSCHKTSPGMLNVHIVPHSHDDVGWLKTVSQYYYGGSLPYCDNSASDYAATEAGTALIHSDGETPSLVKEYNKEEETHLQYANVSAILDTTFQELKKNPDRRYNQVETAFLWMWLQHQDNRTVQEYTELVQNGRMEMVGGGWSMHDEADTHYQSIIDQMSWGLKPDVLGSQVSRQLSYRPDVLGSQLCLKVVCWGKKELLAKSPCSQLCLKVVCWGKKELLAKSPHSQLFLKVMCWGKKELLAASTNQRCQTCPSADLFSGILYNDYGPPRGFCWDLLCHDAEISTLNANDKVRDFLNFVNTQSKFYITDNVLITMGSDFTYMNATLYYTNLDKLIHLVNAEQTNGSNVNLIYSTPSCYLKAVHDSNPALTTKRNDFFPYANEAHAYWTGYYTSRPTLKRFERVGNNFLQVCKQLSAMTGVANKDSSNLDPLREAMGIVQHHDAITGTEKLAVAKDYAKLLSSAMQACGELSQQAINKLLISDNATVDQKSRTVEFKSCPLLNISRCELSETEDDFLVTVYNPLARPVSHYVRIPVTGEHYAVTDPSGSSLVVQLVPVPEPVHSLEKSSVSVKTELIFHAVDLPPLGLRSYRVNRTTLTSRQAMSVHSSDTTIGNQNVTVEINETTGLLKKITVNDVEIPVEQNFHFYRAYSGLNGASNRRSDGAYVFRPQVDETTPIADSANYTTYKGDLVEEIHQVFSDWTSQVIRVYKEESHVEFEWLIDTIPLTSGSGIEPVSRFVTDLSSDRLFYTDSNGRELLERRRDYRSSWNLTVTEPVSGNYYPVTSRILIRDSNQGTEFAVLNDRAQGGSSLKDGQIELMVHRRLKVDDGFGVAEVLNDTEPARGLKSSLGLPRNVHLLTLEPWKDQAVLLRLEHFLEKNEDPILSRDADVNIKNYSSLKQELLAPLTVLSVNETTLDGSQWLSEVDRLQWNVTVTEERTPIFHQINNFTITLSPMQIRTFIVGYY
uniref:Alpha-mannosidase n=1 Tax=Timema monikensis TaxID=170555 RepID=A0A7R9HNR3_9NEOP|nr:unnamed protein product [Timema monikensis]